MVRLEIWLLHSKESRAGRAAVRPKVGAMARRPAEILPEIGSHFAAPEEAPNAQNAEKAHG